MTEQLLDGRYQITQVLAKGGFGQTYLAIDTRRPGQPICVVKQLQPNTHNPQLLFTIQRLFKVEADALEKMGQHSKIPRLLAYFEENHEFYLVQEFIPGHPLSQELFSGHPWSTKQVVDFLIEILEILAFVHSQGVIHRDIKPDNLMRRPDQALVLIDFGSVKKLCELDQLPSSSATVAVGTPAYMPIEQFNGFPQFNSDIYALGIVGIRAASGLSAEEVRTFINPSRPHPNQRNWCDSLGTHVAVHPKLVAILNKMVHADYQQRYPSVQAVLADLQKIKFSANDLHSVLPDSVPRETAPSSIQPTLIPDDRQPQDSTVQTIAIAPLSVTMRTKCRSNFPWRLMIVGSAMMLALISGFHYRAQLTNWLDMPLAMGSNRGNQLPKISLARTLNGHTDAIWSIVLNQNKPTFISGSQDGTLKIWNLNTGRLLQTFAAHADTVRSLALSANGQTLASGNGDTTVKVWNLQTGELRYTFTGHTAPVWSVAVSRDGQTLISGSGDKTIKVWNLQTGQLFKTLSGHRDKVYAVALTPDERTVVSGSADKTLKIWDRQTGKLLQTLTGHRDTVRAIAISPDGTTLASASWDKTIKVWSLQTGKLLQTLEGHRDRVVTVAFSANGQTLASGSLDKTVKLWHVHDGTLRQTLTGHSDWVLSVETSPDGQTLISSSKDKTIKLWHGAV